MSAPVDRDVYKPSASGTVSAGERALAEAEQRYEERAAEEGELPDATLIIGLFRFLSDVVIWVRIGVITVVLASVGWLGVTAARLSQGDGPTAFVGMVTWVAFTVALIGVGIHRGGNECPSYNRCLQH